jgi:hypothetical protein
MSGRNRGGTAALWLGMGLLLGAVLLRGTPAGITWFGSARAEEPAERGAGGEEKEFVSPSEVRMACQRLGIRDWSQLKAPEVEEREAKAILAKLRAGGTKIPLDDFRSGLQIELEHGLKFPEANITNNHPLLTGKIVLAHIKEFPEYYKRLEVLEIEGDMHKALRGGNTAELSALSRKLAAARLELAQALVEDLKP